MKTCNTCGESRPLDAFSKRKDTRDGLSYKCKVCDSAYQAERYKKKADAIKANAKAWAEANRSRRRETNAAWREANKDALRQRNREWHLANRDVQLAKMAEYGRANRERISAKNAAWRRNNPGADLALSRSKKAAKRQRMPAWADKDAIREVYEKAAAMRASGHDVHVDHYYPLQGETVSGLHVHWNLRIVDAETNLRKRNKHPEAM